MSEATLDQEAAGRSFGLVCQAVATACRAPSETLSASTRPADVKGWDSFGRLQVVLELERLVGQELPLERAVAAESILELMALIDGLGV